MLSYNDVSKTYADGTQALKKLSVKIPAGQFCVLLGPSGAGKSTLLKMANYLVEPSGGSVSIDGEAITKRNLFKLRPFISMIHQHFNLVSRLSVEENVIAGALSKVGLWRVLLRLYPTSLRRKAAQLVESVGLHEKHFHRKASELSGGQQQRVGIARAFILEPKIVLADEPVASLDPKISREVLQILKTAAKSRGTAVVCSLHQVELAKEFADRIIGMHDGAIIADCAAEDLDATTIKRIYEGHENELKDTASSGSIESSSQSVNSEILNESQYANC